MIYLSGGVELSNSVDAETLFRSRPNVWTQAIAKCCPNFVFALIGRWQRGNEIAQRLTNILDDSGIVRDNLRPEGAW